MTGNVWEWIQDKKTSYSNVGTDNPIFERSGSGRARRGGSWGDTPRSLRCSYRSDFTPTFKFDSLGFRLVRIGDVTKRRLAVKERQPGRRAGIAGKHGLRSKTDFSSNLGDWKVVHGRSRRVNGELRIVSSGGNRGMVAFKTPIDPRKDGPLTVSFRVRAVRDVNEQAWFVWRAARDARGPHATPSSYLAFYIGGNRKGLRNRQVYLRGRAGGKVFVLARKEGFDFSRMREVKIRDDGNIVSVWIDGNRVFRKTVPAQYRFPSHYLAFLNRENNYSGGNIYVDDVRVIAGGRRRAAKIGRPSGAGIRNGDFIQGRYLGGSPPIVLEGWRIETEGNWNSRPDEMQWHKTAGGKRGVVAFYLEEGGWKAERVTLSQRITIPRNAETLDISASNNIWGAYNIYMRNARLEIYFDNDLIAGPMAGPDFILRANIEKYRGRTVILKIVRPKATSHSQIWLDWVRIGTGRQGERRR